MRIYDRRFINTKIIAAESSNHLWPVDNVFILKIIWISLHIFKGNFLNSRVLFPHTFLRWLESVGFREFS